MPRGGAHPNIAGNVLPHTSMMPNQPMMPPGGQSGTGAPDVGSGGETDGSRGFPGQPGVMVQPSQTGAMLGAVPKLLAGPGVHAPAGVPQYPSTAQAVMSMQQRTNRIAPVAKPVGLDPMTMLQERENRFVGRDLMSD